MAIEIVDFPIKHGDFHLIFPATNGGYFHSFLYVYQRANDNDSMTYVAFWQLMGGMDGGLYQGKTLVNGGLVGKGLAIGEHLIFELDDG